MVKLKTPELTYAKRALIKFVETNDLNPAKDYSNHPVYGKEYKELLLKLNLERDKVLKKYPLTDLKNLKKLSKMKKGLNLKREKKVVEQMPDSTEKKKAKKASKENVAKEENKPSRTPAKKYDYPLVDGREMTADEKKKYRQEQRKLANGDNKPKAKKDKVEKKEKVEKVNKKSEKKSETPSEKKSKKDDKKEKKGLKVSKKGKKSKKDED